MICSSDGGGLIPDVYFFGLRCGVRSFHLPLSAPGPLSHLQASFYLALFVSNLPNETKGLEIPMWTLINGYYSHFSPLYSRHRPHHHLTLSMNRSLAFLLFFASICFIQARKRCSRAGVALHPTSTPPSFFFFFQCISRFALTCFLRLASVRMNCLGIRSQWRAIAGSS